MFYEILEKLKKEIENFEDDLKFESVGIIKECGDGVAKVSGLKNVLSQELLTIETKDGKIPALAFNLEESFVGIIILGDFQKVEIGNRVYKTNNILSVKVNSELLGRVLSPVGEPLDGKGILFKKPQEAKDCYLERQAPLVIEREPVNTPLHTGIKAVDSMIPIGRGQRELIIGDRQTGKTSLALDIIFNQKQDNINSKKVICIYVAIGQKNSKIAKIVKQLKDFGALDYTIVVSAPASSPSALQYLAPYAGCAIGEYFMDRGQDALVIYDDLSKHADAYRQISLLLKRPPGREAYPGDIFYLHARLLERAAKLNKEKGGGSLTALPIIETKLGDISSYIPTNVISITDGQIYLESNLFYQGIRPAINVGLSVSRVGSAAQTKAMKKVAGRLRLELAQLRELQAFVQFTSDLDESTKKQIQRGQLLTEVLKQRDGYPLTFEKQVIILYAALNGFIDDLSLENISLFEEKLFDYLEKMHAEDILLPLKSSKILDDKTEMVLKKAIDSFKNIFNNQQK